MSTDKSAEKQVANEAARKVLNPTGSRQAISDSQAEPEFQENHKRLKAERRAREAETKGKKQMPLRPGHLPNHVERSCLQQLQAHCELRADRLPAGKQALAKLIEKGWIESLGFAYRITPAGEAAMKAKIPTPKKIGNKLSAENVVGD